MTHAVQYLAVIPSPTHGAINIGPLPLRAYAVFILAGIVAACWITELRLRQRGAPKWVTLDVAIWAVPFGLVGGRLYHVITSPAAYFGAGGNPWKAFAIWEGGLGIWGAVALGGVGAWLGCRRLGIPLTLFADALAPGLPVAQAIGRLGNYFNNELYGSHTDLPWGLNVYRWDLSAGHAVLVDGNPVLVAGGPFHPTFLYELLWNLGVAALVYYVDRRWKLGKGRAFALYVMAYTVGRFWIEALRIDEANHFLGMRINNWVSILVFAGALAYFLRVKGPQEHLRVDEDSTVTVVTEDGTPIEGYAPFTPKTSGTTAAAALTKAGAARPGGAPTKTRPGKPSSGARSGGTAASGQAGAGKSGSGKPGAAKPGSGQSRAGKSGRTKK